MAGQNKIFKAGQQIFQAGDPADAMYIVRKGELLVYLQQGDFELKLAQVPAGGIVGEMAFFDQKPRSANVRALTDSEITQISKDDFDKLSKQIPKWFVTLMGSLSERLRQTNDRLQKIERAQSGHTSPFEASLQLIQTLDLLWHKLGIKADKFWQLNLDEAQKQLESILHLPQEKIVSIIKILTANKLIDRGVDQYKNSVLVLKNRIDLERVAHALTQFRKSYPEERAIPEGLANLVSTLCRMATTSAYDSVSFAIDEIIKQGTIANHNTEGWTEMSTWIQHSGETFVVTKISGNKTGIRVNKKDCAHAPTFYKILVELSKIGAP